MAYYQFHLYIIVVIYSVFRIRKKAGILAQVSQTGMKVTVTSWMLNLICQIIKRIA